MESLWVSPKINKPTTGSSSEDRQQSRSGACGRYLLAQQEVLPGEMEGAAGPEFLEQGLWTAAT